MSLRKMNLITPLQTLLAFIVLTSFAACDRGDREDAADQVEEGAEEIEDEVDDAL